MGAGDEGGELETRAGLVAAIYGGVVVAADLEGAGRERLGERQVAVVEEVAAVALEAGGGGGPAAIVITGEEGDGNGRGAEEALGGGSAGGGVDDVAEPEHGGGGVVGEQRAEAALELVVAPEGKEITASAVGGGVAPVQVGHDEQALGGEPERESGIQPYARKDLRAGGGGRW